MRDMRDNLNKHLYGITEKMARWKLCLSQLTGSLAMALSSHYIKHHFNETSKEKAKKMVEFIQGEFENILNRTEWMDNETKKNAFIKSNYMKAIVGYPEELANDTLVQEHYKDVIFICRQQFVTLNKTLFSYVENNFSFFPPFLSASFNARQF